MQKVLVCCGGGIDSSALIHYYLEHGFEIKGLHFDYGHLAFKEEKRALNALSRYYKIHVSHTVLKPAISASVIRNGEFVGRNALFILSALSFLDQKSSLISLGIHAGTFYYDCSSRFVADVQNILDGYFGGTVVLDTPFLAFNKTDIVSWSRDRHLPLELTYSCQRGTAIPCGRCSSCKERKKYAL